MAIGALPPPPKLGGLDERFVFRPARCTLVESTPAADPAPLGLAGFALTTFLLSGHNASFIPDLIWVGPALFYGGLAQFAAGMWEFRNRNVFGATAFSTYGGFWMGLGVFIILADVVEDVRGRLTAADLTNALAWFLFAFAIFNTYMLIASMRVNTAVFMVFLTLEITEILLVIGFFNISHGGTDVVAARGRMGRHRDGGGRLVHVGGGRHERRCRAGSVLPVGRPFVTQSPAAATA